ncbi:DUF2867 domain-containing protein [Pseudonocardia sp. CA-107938]|uniref:DUF2867 domain-containing protein n=1 Tax=Pseudonocardia sp. CA-107938 TaxID=3240021 RepID=UPI003D8AC589
MRIHNVHERVVQATAEQVGALLARLGQPDDVLYPPGWAPLRLDGPVAVGASGTHGRVTEYAPGRLLRLTAPPGLGIAGTHAFTVTPVDAQHVRVRHEVDGAGGPAAWLAWHAVVGPAHDAILEQLLDRVELGVGSGPDRPARVAPFARLLRWATRPRAQAVAVPRTDLLETALPRIDFADAHAVERHAALPDDPQTWADEVFHHPPAWVAGLLGLRQALVGLVGIERGGPESFAIVRASGDEVLLGSDAGHLDFRVSVRCEPRRTVVSTVVQVHNLRGRAYFGLVRLVHPVVVRGMLTRAAASLARKSNAGVADRVTIDA